VIVERAHLTDKGLYSYVVLATARPLFYIRPLAPTLAILFRYPVVLFLPAIQLAAALLLLVCATVATSEVILPAGIAVAVIFVARLLFYLRIQLGVNASDHMMIVVCSGVAVCLLVPTHSVQVVALWYVVAQIVAVLRNRRARKGRFAELALGKGSPRNSTYDRARHTIGRIVARAASPSGPHDVLDGNCL
jgi:hypothetical protein